MVNKIIIAHDMTYCLCAHKTCFVLILLFFKTAINQEYYIVTGTESAQPYKERNALNF